MASLWFITFVLPGALLLLYISVLIFKYSKNRETSHIVPLATKLLDPIVELIFICAPWNVFRRLEHCQTIFMRRLPVHQVRDIHIWREDGTKLPMRIYHPNNMESLPIVVYFHGGGFAIGSIETVDKLCRELCKRIGCIVVSVDYRLSPEYPFPHGFNDAYFATKWVYDNTRTLRGNPDQIVVMGDSAGGNFSAAIALQNSQNGGRDFRLAHQNSQNGGRDFRLAHQVLIYPATDMRSTSVRASKQQFYYGWFYSTRHSRKFRAAYMTDYERDSQKFQASPLVYDGDMSFVPGAFIIVAQLDPLRDEGYDYAQKLRDSNIPVKVTTYAATHGFFDMNMKEAKRAHDDIVTVLREVFWGTERASRYRISKRLRILLTNGRFPVVLDLARQLHKVGHKVYIVDPMHFHITKFSRSVEKSLKVPAPHDSAGGYVDCIIQAVTTLRIQLIIPMHEEIFYLAQVDHLRPILFVPTFHTLYALHNKWHFYQLVTSAGFLAPPTFLIKSMDDVRKLDLSKEYALKPVFGRALSGIHHLKPGEPLPEIEPTDDIPYIAQEWIKGTQLCSYAVARGGEIKAACVYPVIDTIDGSSCVFFKSIDHPAIKHFMEVIAYTYNITGQLAFDFIEADGKLYTLECNPRATSGIHLFNKTPWLAEALTNPHAIRKDAKIGKKMQMVPGMLMWEPREKTKREKVQHTRRLFGTHDILFRMSDPFPAFLQPLLYATYLKQCHEKKLEIKELFQWDVVWEPRSDEIQRARDEIRLANDRVAMAICHTPASSPTSSRSSDVSVPLQSSLHYTTPSVPAQFAQDSAKASSSGVFGTSHNWQNYTTLPIPALFTKEPLSVYATSSSSSRTAQNLPNCTTSSVPAQVTPEPISHLYEPTASGSGTTVTYLSEPLPPYNNATSASEISPQPTSALPAVASASPLSPVLSISALSSQPTSVLPTDSQSSALQATPTPTILLTSLSTHSDSTLPTSQPLLNPLPSSLPSSQPLLTPQPTPSFLPYESSCTPIPSTITPQM